MRRIALILLLLLCGAGPAQKRLLLQGEPSLEQLIRQMGPTLWLDASDPGTITQTATAVSQWSDKSGNGRNAVQATDAAKFVLSRSDNRENLIANSAASATWKVTNVLLTANAIANPVNGAIDAVLLTEDGSTAVHGATIHPISVVTGEWYRLSIYAKAKERFIFRHRFCCNISGHIHVNLQTGAILTESGTLRNVVVTPMGDGWYRLSLEVQASASGLVSYYPMLCNDNNQDTYDGDGSSGLYIYGPQMSRAEADTTYKETTGIRAYRGMGGKPVLVAQGAQIMTMTAKGSDIFANNAKTFFAVVRPAAATAAANRFILASGDYWHIYLATTAAAHHHNYDTDSDAAVSGAITASPLIISGTHEAGNLTINVNGVEGTPDASGNTGSLAGALGIGNRAAMDRPFFGDIAELLTFNKVLPSDVRERIQRGLCKKWGADC